MLQPKNIKKTQNLFWKDFSWVDFLVFSATIILSIVIGYTLLPESVSKYYKFILSVVLILVSSTLLIKSRKYNCRVYILILRMIKYWFSVKKYGNKRNKTELLVPYESILENQFIKTKQLKLGAKYLAILKFQGKSPWYEDDEDKETFLNKFTQLIDTTDFHISFIRKKELSNYQENFDNLQKNLNQKMNYLNSKKASNEIINNYVRYYEDTYEDLKNLDTSVLVDVYYVAIYAKSIAELKKVVNEAINIFNSLDIEANIIKGIDLINFLASLNNKQVDQELANQYLKQQLENKRQVSGYQNQEFKYENNSFKEFLSFLKEQLKLIFSKNKNLKIINNNKTENQKIRLDELISNKKIVFKHNYFICDDKFVSIHTVSDLPLTLPEAWAIPIFDSDSMIVWNLGIFDENTQASLLDKSNKKETDNSTLLKSNYFKKASSIQLQALEYLENQLQVDKNVLTNSSLMIINVADNLKDLRKLEQKNLLNAKRSKININPIPFKQFEGLAQASLITTNNLKESVAMSSYNVSHGWPFQNENNNDNNMFILGESDSTGEPIIFNQFYKNNSRRTNYNMFTVGSSGKGKSTDVKKAIVSNLAQNNKVYVIDPQNEYAKLGHKFGATIIDLGSGYNTTINPLQVQIQLFEEDQKLSIDSIINKHLEWIETFFSLINPDWNQDQLVLVMEFVKELYKNKGLYKLRAYKSLESFNYPIISDLIKLMRNYKFVDEFEEQRKKLTLANIIDRLSYNFEYNGKYHHIYNAQTNIDLSNDFIIFNTQKLFNTSSSNGKVGLFVLLSFIQNKIFNNAIEFANTNTVLVIDELHMYIDPNNPATLDFVYSMTKTVRKFNAGMILCTQNPSDFLGSSMITKKAEAILQNCQYAKFFGLKQKDLEAVIDMFKSSGGLNNSHQKFLADSEIGNLIFSLHSYSKIKMRIYYNEFEKELFFDKGEIGKK
ncbi:Mbov_0397 family ICE element conjugal transfer ATPase [Mycoplasma mycoides]|uniref:Mbov_0397 family ICE element conjugal transfer ATPase n=1 Tax=Mycoplasma mycoides TaxID=2102 RepID=UPI0001793DC4|nr:membrane protein [Mycoplasma mycoides]ACU78254.1 putative membrane protein [Mycoplasma mycoides subsp. capri str. GM12]ACU79084.1 putative membrane protein [Mycoplasma mycoides subsp. capri str. GM12]SRX63283.1 membrane protein [Mycoplasma mycoides subsp. capri]SRX66602.1 membrane protein [Mycoplasma mycoides subsp. capri]SRX68362.1 membrane protein [Mycoplasma mycoides subsp. capri]